MIPVLITFSLTVQAQKQIDNYIFFNLDRGRIHDSSFLECKNIAGAQLKYKWAEDYYAPMNNNLIMAKLFAENLESLGRKVEPFESRYGFGSTDMGNVSQIVPSIHPEIAIALTNTLLHSKEFAKAAATSSGHTGLLDAAKAQAMTAVDLISKKEVLAKAKEEFEISRNKD